MSTAVGDESYSVEEVARRTGTTVRTIRWYQSEGLLAAPRKAGRVARYDEEHVARLEAIRDLQAHGLTLVAIRRLIDQAPGSTATAALAFVRSAVSQPGDEVETVSPAEGMARLNLAPGDEAGAALLEELGLVRVADDGRWQIIAPAAFRAAAELASLGVPLERRIHVTRLLRQHTQAMAEAVVELFLDHLWEPAAAEAADDPAVWETLDAAVRSLRPLAITSVAGFFDAALSAEAEAAAEDVLARTRRRDRP
ncbi:MAG TPA: MerR family transcriptional regulator, partial [Acidimicrobiales bacterium]|nr:MerR family transcriptional regulator [Acidimicrobiales bacterium]